MTVVVTDSKLCYSVYNTQSKILHSTYRGVLNKDQLIAHLNNGVVFGKENEILGSLVDLRKLHGSYYKFFEFLEFEAYPGIQRSGLHYLAFILSDDIIVNNVTKKLMEVIKRLKLEARIFTNSEEGLKWLGEQVTP